MLRGAEGPATKCRPISYQSEKNGASLGEVLLVHYDQIVWRITPLPTTRLPKALRA
jgi:hypothetical protein